MIDSAILKKSIKEKFGHSDCAIFTAPGRINLIGEHTDYNGGFVLPASIDKCISLAIVPNGTYTVHLYSIDYDESVSFDVDSEKPKQQWACYVYGVIQEMKKRGASPGGFDAVFGGDVPLGAGMSSSAALESVFGIALNTLFNLGFDKRELAKIGQMTEHNYVGVRCGIMDQFASLFGQAGKVIKLDCRSLEYELFPFEPQGIRLVLIDTMVKHSLASSEYNVRRAQCEAGVAVIAKYKDGVELLRDVTLEELETHRAEMDSEVYMRCHFVISENQRLLEGCEDLSKGDYELFGQKMFRTHEGLSKEYGVSCEELDFIVEIARSVDGVLGARMMGGGFGGCVLAMVRDENHDEYVAKVREAYQKRFGKYSRVIDVVISDGARQW
ncbi:MAG: galactokinase [Bacteroidales bacterium]|jgi:galactokinase|nr:galactokinase [Bacteroidales bacterium]